MKLKILLAAVVLTWQATWSERTTCPCAQPHLNPYTGKMELPKSVCASSCFKVMRSSMTRTFGSEDEARAFMDGCDQCSSPEIPFPSPCCSGWMMIDK